MMIIIELVKNYIQKNVNVVVIIVRKIIIIVLPIWFLVLIYMT